MSSTVNGQKDTIYIDIDDEITTVIDKLNGSPHKIVALVLPKRAAVFQSVVNMKLLKRAADESKKHIVLITSEIALRPLAGAVGLHVAHNLQSKPEIPPGPGEYDASAATPESDVPLDRTASIGHLATQADDESIQVDNGPDKEAPKTADKPKKDKSARAGSDKKKIRVPNFEKFRNRFILGGIAAVVLIGGAILALIVLPKATIKLKSDTSNIDTNLTLIADTNARALDDQNKLLPAISKEFRRTDTERVPASGQVDKGTKASGEVTLGLKDCSVKQVTIPAGTTVSTDNLSFITQDSANLQSVEVGGSCKNDAANSTKKVDVVSATPGAQYNISSGKSFSVSGYPSVGAGNDNAMSGGTSNIVKVISPADIDKGRQAIQNRANTTAPDDLKNQIQDQGYYPIKETLVAGDPTVTTDRHANDEGDSVTVTSTTVYTMIGVKEKDLKSVTEASIRKKIQSGKQTIRDNGLSKATFRVQKTQESQTTLAMHVVAVVGPDLDSTSIKKEIAGKGRDQTEQILKSWPDITNVEVKYSPFWVHSTPKKASKITLIFEDTK